MKEYAIIAHNNIQDITCIVILESLLAKTIQEYNSKYKYVFVYEREFVDIYDINPEEEVHEYKCKFITSYTNK